MSAEKTAALPTTRSQNWWILITVGVGTFMSALDGSVVNAILPVIRDFFSAGVAAIEWVVVIYLLVVSALLLTFGRLGDLHGHKPVYLLGFAIFVISSALCGMAPSANGLVLFRGLQAIGAAMLMANSPAILTKSFPPAQRGQALGLQATMTYLGLMVGPSLGGWLAAQFGWRWVFYINLPVGLVAFLLTQQFIPRHFASEQETTKRERFDLPGAVVFSLGLVALLLGLNRGHDWGWGSPAILALLGASVLLLAAFILIERRAPAPMLDLSLFSRRTFSTSVLSALLNYIALYGIIFLMPFYLIQGRGLDSAQSGLILTAQPLIMAIVAPISGYLSDKIGSRLLATLGMVILSAGLFLLSRLGPETPLEAVALYLGVAGLGIGIFVSPNNSALMGSAPRARQGIAAGMLATARNVGMVLGVGLAGAIFTTLMVRPEPDAFFTAIGASFAAAAVLAFIGGLTSAVRNSH